MPSHLGRPGTSPRAQRAVVPAPAPARQLPGGAGQGCPEAEHPPWAGPGLAPGRHGGRGQRWRPHPHLVPGPELRHPPPSGPWEAWTLARGPACQVPMGASGGSQPSSQGHAPGPRDNGVSKCRPELSHPSPHHDQHRLPGPRRSGSGHNRVTVGGGGTGALPCLGARHCGFRNPRGPLPRSC